jgi:hypothetical protein
MFAAAEIAASRSIARSRRMTSQATPIRLGMAQT